MKTYVTLRGPSGREHTMLMVGAPHSVAESVQSALDMAARLMRPPQDTMPTGRTECVSVEVDGQNVPLSDCLPAAVILWTNGGATVTDSEHVSACIGHMQGVSPIGFRLERVSYWPDREHALLFVIGTSLSPVHVYSPKAGHVRISRME